MALVVRRAAPPYRGRWALPGGFVHEGEDLVDAASRELEEETGLASVRAHLEQLATYAAPGRDQRGRVVTVAHLALVPRLAAPTAGSDAAAARWQPVAELLADRRRLAFDHHCILSDGVQRARAKLEYYEAVWGTTLDPRNFHRKVTGTPGFVVETGRTTGRDGGRPAQLYRAGGAKLLHPAMLQPA